MSINGEIKKQASAFALELSVPRGDLDFRFNKYWSEVKDVLSPELVKAAKRGGFRDVKRDRVVKAAGGAAEFYKPILAEVVQEWLNKQPRQALTFNDITIQEGIEQYQIRAIVYLEPEISWKKTPPGIDAEPLVVKVPRQPEGIVDRMLDAEIATAQENGMVLVPVPDGTPAVDGNVILLDAQSTIEGQLWAPGSFTNNKWLLETRMFHIPEMYQALLGAKAGEERKLQAVLNEKFSEDVRGKTVDVTLRVGQVFQRDIPKVDDDLAKTYGFDTLEAYKKSLVTKIEKEMNDSRNKLIQLSLTSQIMNPEVVQVEPVPFLWMASKAKEIYAQSRGMVRTEEELVSHFQGQQLLSGTPVTDKATLLTFLAEKVAQQLVHDLVLRAWGQKKGVPGDLTLEMLPEYVKTVKDTLVSSAKVEEYDINEYLAQMQGNAPAPELAKEE